VKIRLCADSMLLVELDAVIDPLVNERAIELAQRLTARAGRGVRDIVPGYCTVGVHFDPLATDLSALERAILDAGKGLDGLDRLPGRPIVEIPVSYGGADGPDLDAVAAFAGCTPEEVVERHAGRTYRVYMLGFVPGFAYMGRVDPTIAAPRHRMPREKVPAGSVGIAGEQTGVYPMETPGGWQLVGRTRLQMFDASRERPSLLAPGDLVRFVPETVRAS
jgi:KipI family sensor histidine kinase inhibitor